jgi:hypothetical protein
MHVLNPQVHRADKAEGPALRGHVDKQPSLGFTFLTGPRGDRPGTFSNAHSA